MTEQPSRPLNPWIAWLNIAIGVALLVWLYFNPGDGWEHFALTVFASVAIGILLQALFGHID